jgi:pantoate--beta-alanine ligase
MKIFDTVKSIQEELFPLKKQGLKIGFIPTMGALHEGHISLVRQAKEVCDYVVVSVFVNPTQFNNPSDLDKYPRTLDKDIDLLTQTKTDFLFTPSSIEVYPTNYKAPFIDLGILDKVMEGKFRPGHFQGVVEVVKRLFEIVQPDFAYFGKKDFQQVAVIKSMVKTFQFPLTIVECPIIRNENGLAMSSRNARLSPEEQKKSLVIYETLLFAKNNAKNYNPKELVEVCKKQIETSDLQLEYVEIVHPATLLSLSDQWEDGAVCCIAAYCGEVRLIDNMVLVEN